MANFPVIFDNCGIDQYYEGFDPNEQITGETLQAILHDIIDDHRSTNFLLSDEAFEEILNPDPSGQGEVIDVYTLQPKFDFPNDWNREHTWPSSLGVGDDGIAHDDLMHLYPADRSFNSARSNRFFDECTPGVGSCESPAAVGSGNTFREAAAGSSQDRFTFSPPFETRGDLARAIFYVATRYDGSDPGTNKLFLDDCNDFITCADNTFGNLTTLLRWHEEDPVSEAETKRVTDICERFQGNRNPYVDFPQLARQVFDRNFVFEDNDDDGGNGDNNNDVDEGNDNTAILIAGIVVAVTLIAAVISLVAVRIYRARNQRKDILEAQQTYNGNMLGAQPAI